MRAEPKDRLTAWAVAYLASARDRSLTPMLEAALDRRYLASPRERFFTGGGVHRLMRDLANHESARFSLADRSYLARVHPLELWLVDYLRRHPKATEAEVVAAGADVRQEVYGWLFKPNRKRAQDRRIETILEQDAFTAIHAQ